MSATTDWKIYVYNTGTLAWDFDYDLARPNDVLILSLLHNQQKYQLADGSYAFITPENRTTRDQVSFTWIYKDNDFKNQIEEYANNHDYLKITTHNVDIEFIGRFVAINPTWLSGVNGDYFDITTTFEIME